MNGYLYVLKVPNSSMIPDDQAGLPTTPGSGCPGFFTLAEKDVDMRFGLDLVILTRSVAVPAGATTKD